LGIVENWYGDVITGNSVFFSCQDIFLSAEFCWIWAFQKSEVVGAEF